MNRIKFDKTTLLFIVTGFLLIISPCIVEAQITEVWDDVYDGPVHDYDNVYAIDMDPSGNIYVTGLTEGRGTDYDYATISYTPSGARRWVRWYNRSGTSRDIAFDLAVDSHGNIYVTGLGGGYMA